MIDLNRHLFFDLLGAPGLWVGGLNLAIALLPFIGGLIVGPLVAKYAPEAKGHGVPEVMEAIYLRRGDIRSRVAAVKILASSITIGSGGSAGREGPIAQIGAALGSIMGRLFKLEPHERRLLVVCGLAAGIAGTFNAPLGGAVFGMEVLYRGIEPFDAIPILIATVVGTAVATSQLGSQPAFSTAGLGFEEPAELAFYLVLGVIFGFIAVMWVKIFYGIEELFRRMGEPEWLKPAIGGLVTGVIGLLLPAYGLMGVGYEGIEAALAGKLPPTILPVLGLAKMVATGFTVGSGGSGGIFAPSLYIGCMLGGGMGLLFKAAAPTIVTNPYVYSLAGMASLFAGAAQAPLTVITMIPEMSDNYSLLLPIMMSSSASYFVAWSFMRGSSIYTLKLERRGVRIRVGRPEVLDLIMVKDVMSRKLVTVKADAPASVLELMVLETGHQGFPVVDNGRLVGIVTMDDLRKVKPEELNRVKIRDIATRRLVVAYPDELLSSALSKMYENSVGRLPVVDPRDSGRLVGIITKKDILKAYRSLQTY